jgi:hypothetical protein
MTDLRQLDEFSIEELTDEIERRLAARRAGLCEYCGRSTYKTEPCRFPERHCVGVTLWTVYKNPSDHPRHWVARGCHSVAGDRRPVPLGKTIVTDDLDLLRGAIPPGFRVFTRLDNDEPTVFEHWIRILPEQP